MQTQTEMPQMAQQNISPGWFDVLYKRQGKTLFGDETQAKIEASGKALLQWYRDRLRSIFPHVENPFLWKTKADILREIKVAGASQLCARTSSCTHTLAQTTMHTHCGVCSQCVDRRLNALAAGFDGDEDPQEMYASDVVTGAREGADLTMIERYVGTSLEIERLTTAESFMVKFPEASRLIRHLGMTANEAAEAVFDLYRRHAREICHTLTKIVSADAASVVKRHALRQALKTL